MPKLNSMTRQEHLDWCKQRAFAYAKNGELKNAFASMQSDMSKHPETQNHLALEMGTMLLVSGHLSTILEMEDWINGFN